MKFHCPNCNQKLEVSFRLNHIIYSIIIFLIIIVSLLCFILLNQNKKISNVVHSEKNINYGLITPILKYYSPGKPGAIFAYKLTNFPDYKGWQWKFENIKNVSCGQISTFFTKSDNICFDVEYYPYDNSSALVISSYLPPVNAFNEDLSIRFKQLMIALNVDSTAQNNMLQIVNNIPRFGSNIQPQNALYAFGTLAMKFGIHNEIVEIIKQNSEDKKNRKYADSIPEKYPLFRVILSKQWSVEITNYNLIKDYDKDESRDLTFSFYRTKSNDLIMKLSDYKKDNRWLDWPTINPFNIKQGD